MKQFYFLVYFDEETGKFAIDNETCVMLMSDGTVFDQATGQWEVLQEAEEWKDQLAHDSLYEALNGLTF